MGVSLVGVLLYFSLRRPRGQPRKDAAHTVSSPATMRYEKPELTGEDAYTETDAAERRTAEMAGDEIGFEMEGGRPARQMGILQAI